MDDPTKAGLARELLELEKRYEHGLAEGEASRWEQLVTALFGEDRPTRTRRRSFRLPAEVQAQVRIGQATFGCTLRAISQIGATLSGPIFAHAHRGELVLSSVRVAGQDRLLEMRCEIIRVDAVLGGLQAGVRFEADNPEGAKRRFFSDAYYPLYLQYLQFLADGGAAPG
jgi:hypothetical protein